MKWKKVAGFLIVAVMAVVLFLSFTNAVESHHLFNTVYFSMMAIALLFEMKPAQHQGPTISGA